MGPAPDSDYTVMASDIELVTEVDKMPQECELSKISTVIKNS